MGDERDERGKEYNLYFFYPIPISVDDDGTSRVLTRTARCIQR